MDSPPSKRPGWTGRRRNSQLQYRALAIFTPILVEYSIAIHAEDGDDSHLPRVAHSQNWSIRHIELIIDPNSTVRSCSWTMATTLS